MAFDLEQERQARARIDELAILRHAQNLKAVLGRDRAEQALQAALREISSEDILAIRSASRPCKTMIAASSISGVRRPGPNGTWVVVLITMVGCLFAIFYVHLV